MRSDGARFAALLASLLSCRPALAEEAPDPEGARGLLSDLERIVAAEEDTWFSDEREFEEIYPTALESVCRASPAARREALAFLGAELARTGEPRELFRTEGMTDRVEDALSLWRRKRALEMSIEGAERDCPFWVEPSHGFRGRQTDRERFLLALETGGIVQIRQTEGTWTFGGGGTGRVLPGYGFGERFTLLGGVEFGGGAMLRPNTSPSQFVINYFPAIPVVFRWRSISWHYELETAAVGLFQADAFDVSYGVRFGGGVGVSALRTRTFIPWAGAAIAYEHYFPGGGRERAHFLRGGLRVGLRWDP